MIENNWFDKKKLFISLNVNFKFVESETKIVKKNWKKISFELMDSHFTVKKIFYISIKGILVFPYFEGEVNRYI